MRPQPFETRPRRMSGIDTLRGAAIAWMIGFHFCYDLSYVGLAGFRMLQDPFWTTQRTLIVTCFLLIAGLSLVLRDAFKPGWADFWKRWAQIAGASILVSVGSYLLFPRSYIYFGVLHFVAAGLVLTRLLRPLGKHVVWLGVAAVAAPLLFQSEAFNPRAFNWIGFATQKPVTEDYVPLFPWLGILWIGYGLGWWWRDRGFAGLEPFEALGRVLPSGITRALNFLGRWPLTTYLIHQPILLGALLALRPLIK